jgi:hypothetical protein
MEVSEMSYWSHNPEKYDDIIRKGILHWMDRLIDEAGFEGPREWSDGYEALIETLQMDPHTRDVYDAMCNRASKDIINAEQDYFSGLADWPR